MFLLSRQTASLSDLFKIPLTSCLSSYENPEVHLVIMGSPPPGQLSRKSPSIKRALELHPVNAHGSVRNAILIVPHLILYSEAT